MCIRVPRSGDLLVGTGRVSTAIAESLTELAERGSTDPPLITDGSWFGIRGDPHAARLDDADSAKVLALARVIGHVHSIVVDSSALTKFEVGAWLADSAYAVFRVRNACGSQQQFHAGVAQR